MKTVSSIVLISLVLVGFALTAQAQEVTATGVTPCPDDIPGRPTLRKRQPASNGGANAEVAKSGDPEKCTPNNVVRPTAPPPLPFKFEGLVNVDESDLRRYINSQQAEQKRVSPESPAYFAEVADLVKRYLEMAGYRHAKVTQRAETNTESVKVVFVIDQGSRPPILEYRFEGNHVFPTARLAGELAQCMAGYNRDYYETDVFDYCVHLLDNYARSQGYLQARFHDPKVTETGQGLIITLTADEGVLYRLGSLTFDGDLVVPADKLQTMFPGRKGDILNVELMSKFLYEDLKRTYGERGYVQYFAEVTPEFKTTPGGEGLINLAITIDAGRRYKVSRITFAGEKLPNNLLNLMLINAGDTFNQVLFERSIETLNNTGMFEFIDKDKDTDFHSDDEEGLLDIVIKLTRKNP